MTIHLHVATRDEQLALFAEAEAWDGDPIRPATGEDDGYTPLVIVAKLSRHDRALRVRHLTEQAHLIADAAETIHADGRTITGRVILFSGGNDSTVLAHLFRRYATYAAHANTGIGIEQTREFVRSTCAAWDLPLIEHHGESYRDLVLDQGFPGPAMHWKMYQRLKERALRDVRRDLVQNSRRERVLFLAGRRRQESERREDVVVTEREDAVIWASPLAHWTALDLTAYRGLHDVPTNPVSANLHMSGECLCGAFAKPGELDLIAEWYPDVAAEIRALEAEVAATGRHHPDVCTWGHGKGRKSKSGRLCGSCDARFAALFEVTP